MISKNLISVTVCTDKIGKNWSNLWIPIKSESWKIKVIHLICFWRAARWLKCFFSTEYKVWLQAQRVLPPFLLLVSQTEYLCWLFAYGSQVRTQPQASCDEDLSRYGIPVKPADVALLASSRHDFQYVLELFADECKVGGMTVSPSKPNRVECSLWLGDGSLPQTEVLKYLWLLFANDGRMERGRNRRMAALSAVMRALH